MNISGLAIRGLASTIPPDESVDLNAVGVDLNKLGEQSTPFTVLGPYARIISLPGADNLTRLVLLDMVGEISIIPGYRAVMNTPDILSTLL